MVFRVREEPAVSLHDAGTVIREATGKDTPNITHLIRQLAASSGETSPATDAYVDDYLASPGNRVLLAETCGEVVGLLSYSVKRNLYHAGDSCVIEELVVREDARGRGVGGALLLKLLSRMEAAGCAEVSVTVLPENSGAIRFYRRHGLTDEAVFLEKHFGKPE
jgi:ribosomal protein S18 acetylase RimI-like enzyme